MNVKQCDECKKLVSDDFTMISVEVESLSFGQERGPFHFCSWKDLAAYATTRADAERTS